VQRIEKGALFRLVQMAIRVQRPHIAAVQHPERLSMHRPELMLHCTLGFRRIVANAQMLTLNQ
jgi:hypothetical protein